MLVVLVLIANALAAATTASNYVKKNRGQLLEMPDWRLVSDMTMILFMFIFSASLLSVLYFKTGGNPCFYILGLFSITILLLIYMAIRSKTIRQELQKRAEDIYKKIRKFRNRKKHENTNSEQTFDLDQYQAQEDHEKKFSAALSYAENTLLYTIWRYLIILLVQAILYFILSLLPATSKEIQQFLSLGESDFGVTNVLNVTLILEYVGIWISLIRIVSVMQYVKKKPRRKNLVRIKDYLKNEEVKN